MFDLATSLRNLDKNGKLSARAVKAGLAFASCFYRFAVNFRELTFLTGLQHTHKLPAPVISIGNITAGGTGKTPAVVRLVQMLPRITERTPVILSRGYGADEVRLLADLLPGVPHFVDKDRFLAGMKAIADLGKNLVFVLDDGFQHRRLKRDLDIVLVDATEPFGLGHVLPRGFLRESLRYLRKAQVIVITRCDLVSKAELRSLTRSLNSLAKNASQVKTIHSPAKIRQLGESASFPPQSLERKSLLMFAGIGNPTSFRELLRRLGANVVVEKIFPDHYRYKQRDLEELYCIARDFGAKGLVTTAKDAVKLTCVSPPLPVWVLDIELDIIKGERQLTFALQKALEKSEGIENGQSHS